MSLEPNDHLNGPDPTKEEVAAKMRAWFPFIAPLAAVVLVLAAANCFLDGASQEVQALRKEVHALRNVARSFVHIVRDVV
jgi:hypothetical protein